MGRSDTVNGCISLPISNIELKLMGASDTANGCISLPISNIELKLHVVQTQN